MQPVRFLCARVPCGRSLSAAVALVRNFAQPKTTQQYKSQVRTRARALLTRDLLVERVSVVCGGVSLCE